MYINKKGYLIHFARLFFISLLFGLCSFISHLWNVYQPFHLTFQFQQCQSTVTNKKDIQINIWNWLNDFHLIDLFPSFTFLSKSSSTDCQFYIKNYYPLDANQFFQYIYFILMIYFLYHLLCLLIFHIRLKQLESKQKFYAHLYRKDEKIRCSKRLL